MIVNINERFYLSKNHKTSFVYALLLGVLNVFFYSFYEGSEEEISRQDFYIAWVVNFIILYFFALIVRKISGKETSLLQEFKISLYFLLFLDVFSSLFSQFVQLEDALTIKDILIQFLYYVVFPSFLLSILVSIYRDKDIESNPRTEN